jgi:dephospho-CoA kinase
MKRTKLKIGITGNIGSGKSLFSKYIKSFDYPVLNADEISKTIIASDPAVKKAIIDKFGDEAFINGKINKKYLAEKIFTVPKNVLLVNSILHPKVIGELEKKINGELKKNNLVFVEAALIYEAEMENIFDYVVLISSEANLRKQRKTELDNFTEKDFMNRERNQIKEEEKKKRADFIFENNRSKQDLEDKAEFLIKILNGILN